MNGLDIFVLCLYDSVDISQDSFALDKIPQLDITLKK